MTENEKNINEKITKVDEGAEKGQDEVIVDKKTEEETPDDTKGEVKVEIPEVVEEKKKEVEKVGEVEKIEAEEKPEKIDTTLVEEKKEEPVVVEESVEEVTEIAKEEAVVEPKASIESKDEEKKDEKADVDITKAPADGLVVETEKSEEKAEKEVEAVKETDHEKNETPTVEKEKTDFIEDWEEEEVKEEKEKPEFDWDALGEDQDTYTKKERSKLEEVYDKTLSQIAEHEVVDGTVVAMNNREVVVNIGFKSDGVLPLNELRYNPDLKVGDTVEVYVETQEDPNGQLILSHKKARILRSWERINDAYDKELVINGYVKCRTKGGLIVDVYGIEAFLPGSQIDVKPIRDYDVFVDKTMEFKVVKINHEYKNVVVSHKALIEDELETQRAEIIAKLEKGQILEGTVKNITSYGVFVDLGGVDGLIHITDLSWGRINHPDEIVELDQKIKVAILDFDENKKRIALGLKQLTPHPWDALDKKLKVGDKLSGKVVVMADYGAFIEIAPGVEGLIHVSEMSWSQHLRTAQDFLKVGDIVEAVILTLSREERKMSLGMKQLIPDPWENILDKYPVNSKHQATVRNFTNFGIFVELEEGIDGLIHISDLSWSKKIKHPAEFTKIGESIDVVVLDVDTENRRLSLGHKQLEENPWEVFSTVFTVGSIHKGTIISSSDKGYIITLPYGVEGFCPMRHSSKEDGSQPKVDEVIDFKVIEFSKENKKIILSHSRVYQDTFAAEKAKQDSTIRAEAKSTQKAVRKVKDSLEKTTLGDLGALAKLKKDMEATEKKVVKKPKKEE